MTVSKVILLSDALKKGNSIRKENLRDFRCVNCLKKGKRWIFPCVNKGTRNVQPEILPSMSLIVTHQRFCPKHFVFHVCCDEMVQPYYKRMIPLNTNSLFFLQTLRHFGNERYLNVKC